MAPDDEINESETDRKNDQWFKDNYIDLMQEHARDWIAVMDQKIIAVSSNETDLELEANKVAGDNEYSIYFVSPTSPITDVCYPHREES